MASSSWIYDVFLSFRGEDTRKSFVDHIYLALKERGIHAYKDDKELRRGKSIRPSILKAIKDSRIAVIIFSKNYANYSWCLNELAYIMECRDVRGQIVMPIFYDVDPSDVRNQTGEFGHGFAKQKQENITKAESLRKVLEDASNIAGWEPKRIANGHEAQVIREIVDALSKELSSTNPYVDDGLVGMEERLLDMKSLLKVGESGVHMVGIWGIGGSGKTTLATSVYMDICQHFDGHCIIENIREEASNINGLKTLQEKILSSVLRAQMTVQSVMHGKRELKHRLCGSSVLIILDDVDDHEQLKALAGSHDWFGNGSRIIITTRDEHLLNKHKVDIVTQVRLLSSDESFRLFYKNAFNENKHVEDFTLLSQRVISYAGGLPIALIIIGSFLYDKDKNEWMSTLSRLEKIPETKIVEKLIISYDGLQHVEKELFLDIACFFRRKKIDQMMDILDACGFHPGIGITVLRQKALITTSDGMFDMHDLIQEMAFHIIRGDHPNNPEEHNRIWQSEKLEEMCSMKENYKTEAIQVYDDQDFSSHTSQHFKLVSTMRKLRYLNYCTLACDKCDEGPTFLSSELRYLSISAKLDRSLPVNFELKKLVVLKLEYSRQQELWKGKQDLPNLRTIELVGLHNLKKAPDLDGLPNLERFMLSGSSYLQEMHPSIGRLERLVCVIIQGCYNLKRCPPITQSKKLATLILSGCSELFDVSEIQQNMGNFRYIELDKRGNKLVSVSHKPSVSGFKYQVGKGDVTPIHKLDSTNFLGTFLSYCSNNINGYTKDLIDVKCRLEEPCLPHNNTINYLVFQSFHRGLRKLDLRWCNLVDENICSTVLEFPNLQELDLRASGFSQLNFSLLQLPQLKWLDVSSCANLVKLSKLPSTIGVLIADNCRSLETLGGISLCTYLWKVSLMGDNKLGVLGGDILLDSMLQGYAIEQHFISFALTNFELWKEIERSRRVWKTSFTLQLPHNWQNDFCGFIITAVSQAFNTDIALNIKQEPVEGSQFGLEPEVDCQPEPWQESNEAPEPENRSTIYVGYFSFGSLRHTEWLKLTESLISFSLKNVEKDCLIVAELVPRISIGDAMQSADAATDFSEFWNEHEDSKTFTIQPIRKNFSIDILWRPCYWY